MFCFFFLNIVLKAIIFSYRLYVYIYELLLVCVQHEIRIRSAEFKINGYLDLGRCYWNA